MSKPKLIKERKFKKYQKCLINYKTYLKNRFKKKNQERVRLERELNFVNDIEDYYGGSDGGSDGGGYKKWKGKRLENCVKKFSKALDKEEVDLKNRLLRIKVEKQNLKRHMREALAS